MAVNLSLLVSICGLMPMTLPGLLSGKSVIPITAFFQFIQRCQRFKNRQGWREAPLTVADKSSISNGQMDGQQHPMGFVRTTC